jgi:hypothetical protein
MHDKAARPSELMQLNLLSMNIMKLTDARFLHQVKLDLFSPHFQTLAAISWGQI